MNTLIIPCAGKSSRFPNMPPKWLLRYPDGNFMVKKAIEGLPIEDYDRIIVTTVKKHIEKYDANAMLSETLSNVYGNKYEMLILDDFTSCQAETIYRTVNELKVEGAFTVKDSDNYIKMNLKKNNDFVVGINMHTFGKEVERLSAKSFLKVNSQNIITDIIEKKIVSEYISIGMYGFRDARLFCEAYEHISKNKDTQDEIYISHVISYLIGTNRSLYSYIEADDYEDWGTLKDWYNVLDRKRTYIINADDILVDTHTEINNFVIKKDAEELLKAISDNGAQIIILGTQNKRILDEIASKMEKKGISIHSTVPNCFGSHQTIIRKFSSEIPYPACEAINIEDFNNIKQYINYEG